MSTSLSYYDVTATEVKKYIPRAVVDGNVAPGLAEIGQGGEFLAGAAAELADALREGGFSSPLSCTSSINVEAYWIVHPFLAKFAALKYLDSISKGQDPNIEPSNSWSAIRRQLEGFKSGSRIGEITVISGRKTGRVYYGTTETTSTMAEKAFRRSDEL
jgi:hypothetical protein